MCLQKSAGVRNTPSTESRLTSTNVPGLKPSGLASVFGTSAGPGLRSKRHDRPGEAIVHQHGGTAVRFVSPVQK